MKRVLGMLNGAVTLLLVLVIAGALAMALSARRSPDGIPTVAGHKWLIVLSGSMEPAIHTGDVIAVEPTGAEADYQVGDVITFASPEDPQMLITHRIVGILRAGDRQVYVTKGDANDSEDLSPVTPEQILGRYRYRIPYFGHVSTFLHKPVGIVVLVILPGAALVGMELRKIWKLLDEMEAARREATPAVPGDFPSSPQPAATAGESVGADVPSPTEGTATAPTEARHEAATAPKGTAPEARAPRPE